MYRKCILAPLSFKFIACTMTKLVYFMFLEFKKWLMLFGSKSQDFKRGWMWFSAVPLAETNIAMWVQAKTD